MKSRQIPVSIAARLIYHLGEQLISDELVALLELIKNSYDADATRCVVSHFSFDGHVLTLEAEFKNILIDFLRRHLSWHKLLNKEYVLIYKNK